MHSKDSFDLYFLACGEGMSVRDVAELAGAPEGTCDGWERRRARDEGRLERKAALVGCAGPLVIDELGFLSPDADGARLLFQVFADARERQSVVIATNLEFSRWGSMFGDDQMAAAVIDRVVHHGRLIQLRGEFYRMRHALMQEG